MKTKQILCAGVLLAAASLSACAPRAYAYYRVGPPPPVPAYRAYAAPGPGYVWTDGFYDLRGSRWAWEEDRYQRPPRANAVWVAPRWERHGQGWRFHEGRWR